MLNELLIFLYFYCNQLSFLIPVNNGFLLVHLFKILKTKKFFSELIFFMNKKTTLQNYLKANSAVLLSHPIIRQQNKFLQIVKNSTFDIDQNG